MASLKPVEIAPGVHWYSAGVLAGNIYFVQDAASWVLIDTATAGQRRRPTPAQGPGARSRPPAVRRGGRVNAARLRAHARPRQGKGWRSE